MPMDPENTLLFVDVGQTGSRVMDSRGHRYSLEAGFLSGTALETVVINVLSQLKNPTANTLILSLTGLRGQVPSLESLAQACSKITGCEELGVCDDGLAWSVGSLGGKDGVSLAVGGGVVSVSKAREKYYHLDGNGSDFGDSGGAYWLGKKGIRAAIRALEGSEIPTSLTKHFEDRFGHHDEFVRSHLSKSDVHRASIQFADSVLVEATTGDGIALDILSTGAIRLASVAAAAAVQAGLFGSHTTVALGGGLMKHMLYRQLVEEQLSRRGSFFEVIEPAGDALDGLSYLEQHERHDILSLMRWWRP